MGFARHSGTNKGGGGGGCGCAPTEWMWVCGWLLGARGVVHVAFITLPPYRLLVTRRQRFSGLRLVDTTRSCQNDGETTIDCEKKKAPSLLPRVCQGQGLPSLRAYWHASHAIYLARLASRVRGTGCHRYAGRRSPNLGIRAAAAAAAAAVQSSKARL